MAEYPRQFQGITALGNATTSGDLVSFGFNAKWMQLDNQTANPIHVNFTGVRGSTGDYALSTGVTQFTNIPPIAGLGLKTTSTDATDKDINILALAGL